jgi:hypothetical protein
VEEIHNPALISQLCSMVWAFGLAGVGNGSGRRSRSHARAYNLDKVVQVAAEIDSVHLAFRRSALVEEVMGRLSSLKLKARLG